MNKRMALVFALAMAGCATPSEVCRDGIRTDYTLRRPPAQAARCLANNADEYMGLFDARVRDTDVADVFEVLVRTDLSVVAVAVVRPSSTGSTATIWRSVLPLTAIGLPAAMAKGC